MEGSSVYSNIDLRDGYNHVLMRSKVVPLTAVSTPSGMLYEYLVLPQGVSNGPATFNRLVTHVFRPLRAYCRTYFDDIFVFSKAEENRSAMEVHKDHLKAVLDLMRQNKFYGKLAKCTFGASEIPVLGCCVARTVSALILTRSRRLPSGLHSNPSRNCANGLAWPTTCTDSPRTQKAKPLTDLLKKDVPFQWNEKQQQAFDEIKRSLSSAPILALPNSERAFSVVCDASDFAIGSALMQEDDQGHDRVIAYESRQLKAAERNYPVYEKELLSVKYALEKFRVHLLGQRPFIVYTDHASLRFVTQSKTMTQRHARGLAFFAEYNFRLEYKPGKRNVVADALSRRPDYVSMTPTKEDSVPEDSSMNAIVAASSSLYDQIRAAYEHDSTCRALLGHFVPTHQDECPAVSSILKARLRRFSFEHGLLWYQILPEDNPRIVVPADEDLRHVILFEMHDAPPSGHLGVEKTYLRVASPAEFGTPLCGHL